MPNTLFHSTQVNWWTGFQNCSILVFQYLSFLVSYYFTISVFQFHSISLFQYFSILVFLDFLFQYFSIQSTLVLHIVRWYAAQISGSVRFVPVHTSRPGQATFLRVITTPPCTSSSTASFSTDDILITKFNVGIFDNLCRVST